jgi:hypothetical protein
MVLVDAFSPSERQRKSAMAIQEHKPISLEQANELKTKRQPAGGTEFRDGFAVPWRAPVARGR